MLPLSALFSIFALNKFYVNENSGCRHILWCLNEVFSDCGVDQLVGETFHFSSVDFVSH